MWINSGALRENCSSPGQGGRWRAAAAPAAVDRPFHGGVQLCRQRES